MNVVNKQIPLKSFTVSLESIKKIYTGLQRAVCEEANLALAQWKILDNQTVEQFDARKTEVRNTAFQVTVSIYREDGSFTYGESAEIFEFSGTNAPITRIYMTNTVAYRRVAEADPTNAFQLMFDFAQPPLLDANSFVSSPTANVSSLQIAGYRDGWLAGVEKNVLKNIDIEHRFRAKLHGPFVYDLGLMLIGVPLALYACWLASGFIENTFAEINDFVRIAAYIYVLFGSLWCYRILFGYTKWAFPVVELKEQTSRPRLHRKFWWGIVAIIVGRVFWDFFDPYLSIYYWRNSSGGS